MQALDQLNSKLDQLLKKHAATEAENKRFRDTIAAQTREIEELSRHRSSLEKDMVSVRIGRDTGNEEERDNMRRQLDVVISEIDKILNTLND
jgi:cupin superfamily acireductone dioxygenase involved in methionine salvage